MTARCSTARRAASNPLPVNARGYPDTRFTLQIAVEDCTGCGICIENCPAYSPREPDVKAINIGERCRSSQPERENIAFFEKLPAPDREKVNLPIFAACSFWSRCSNSPAPAPVAAKRLISSWSRNCSATGCRSPTPRAAPSIYGGQSARASLAGRCRRARRRLEQFACSRTMPNSASAIVWRSTRRRERRARCWSSLKPARRRRSRQGSCSKAASTPSASSPPSAPASRL